jgi:LPXTG-motif cell wall-anchored protein
MLNYIGATLFESSIAASSPILFILVMIALALGIGIYFYIKKKMSTKCDINQEQQP